MTAPGTTLLDRYRIERELGAGGMATVYLAYDLRHDRKVALKVLRPELAAVIGGARFLAEIRTTANLQHPHILALYDSGQTDTSVFYVMPFVDGETLRDRLTREHRLPIDDALQITREVADALVANGSYAQQIGAESKLAEVQQRRFDLATLRYRQGEDSYLNVLSAQQDLYNAQQSLLQTQYNKLASQIALYKALGGGWK